MSEYEKAFQGVWIPKSIWQNEELGWTEKMLLVEIKSLDNSDGCYAGNQHFSSFFGLSKDRISKMVTELRRKDYISVELGYKEGTKQIEKRIIRVNLDKYGGRGENTDRYGRKILDPIGENADTPLGENAVDNNTSINNTINIKPSRSKYEICDMENAELLFQMMKENNPDAKQPNIETWARDMGLLRRIDKRTDEQIKYLINWTQKDDFWHRNILSPSKLRKQWDQLVLKVKEQKERGNKQQYGQPTKTFRFGGIVDEQEGNGNNTRFGGYSLPEQIED